MKTFLVVNSSPSPGGQLDYELTSWSCGCHFNVFFSI